MPTYEYECTRCKTGPVDVLRSISDETPELCGRCRKPMRKLVSAFSSGVPMLEEGDFSPEEVDYHLSHAKDVEKAARTGKLQSFKPSKKKPAFMQPQIPKTLH